jgi:hypothetical protein
VDKTLGARNQKTKPQRQLGSKNKVVIRQPDPAQEHGTVGLGGMAVLDQLRRDPQGHQDVDEIQQDEDQAEGGVNGHKIVRLVGEKHGPRRDAKGK